MAETTLISPHAQAQLVSRLRNGDTAAYTEIFHLFTSRAIDQAYNVLADREQSMDIVQDIMLKLWVNRQTLDPDVNLEAYIYVAVRNGALQVIRHGKVKERYFDQMEKRIWGQMAGETTTENMVYQRELQERLKAAVGGLSELAQEIYRLSREEHLSYQEIADRLALKDAKVVENQLVRAMKKIRESLGDFLPLLLLFLGPK